VGEPSGSKRKIKSIFSSEELSLSSQPILVHCKPGLVHLWSLPSSDSAWSGTRTLIHNAKPLSIGASTLSPASGIVYSSHHDALIVTLFDGFFQAIHSLSVHPSWSSENDSMMSEHLSTLARSVFAHSEEGSVQRVDVNRISGVVSYDDSGIIAWLHESVEPLFNCVMYRAQYLCKGMPTFESQLQARCPTPQHVNRHPTVGTYKR
jgi:hypothetical protein